MSEWQKVLLGDLLTRITYGFTNPMPTTESGPYMVTAKDIRHGQINYSTARLTSQEAFENLLTDKSRPRIGDVLLTKDGSIGRVAVCDRPNVCINQSVALLQPNGRVLPEYLAYLLQAPEYQEKMAADADGSTIKHIYITRVDKMAVTLPPLSLQRAIAEVLGSLDDKIAANTKLATTAESLALATYRDAVERLPVVPLSSVLTPILGGTPARSRTDYWGGEVPWISAKDVTGTGNGVIIDTAETITDLAVATTKAKPLPAGSVVLTARGTVGAVARLGRAASFNQSCYGFSAEKIPAGLLYMVVREVAERAKSLAYGSVFDTITMKTFDDLMIPDFPDEALAALERRIGPLLDAVAAAEIQTRRLVVTREALLPAIMSGRLTVRDVEVAVESAVDGGAVEPEALASSTLW